MTYTTSDILAIIGSWAEEYDQCEALMTLQEFFIDKDLEEHGGDEFLGGSLAGPASQAPIPW